MFQNFRRYRRYSISASAVIKRRDVVSPEELRAKVTTISQGGMGFYTPAFIEKSTPVSVELLSYAKEGMTKKDIIEGKIASVSSQDNDYFVGIAFDREIAYDRFTEILGWD